MSKITDPQSHRLRVGGLVLLLVVVSFGPPAARGGSPSPEALTSYVIGFSTLPAEVQEGADLPGATVTSVNPTLGFAVVDAEEPSQVAAWVAGQPSATYLELNQDFAPLVVPDDPRIDDQYALAHVGAFEAWSREMGSSSTTLCLVDSGIRTTHEEFQDGRVLDGHNAIDGSQDIEDDLGHGTSVTGVASATTGNARGIAGLSQVGILLSKVFDASGTTTSDVLADGIQWCADSGADVISMSLGGPGARTVENAIDYAATQGAVLVASAGNDGCISNCVEYPAAYPEVIAVGATDSNKDRAPFSSGGPELELMAPGLFVLTTDASGDQAYDKVHGTSMAAPQVAAAAALALSQVPWLTPAEVRERLVASAEDLGSEGHDWRYGHGLLRVDGLMEGLLPAAPQALTVDRGPRADSLALSWQAPTDEGASPVEGYHLFRRPADPSGLVRSDDASAEARLLFDGTGDTVVKVLEIDDPLQFGDIETYLWVRASASTCTETAGSYRFLVNGQTTTVTKEACSAWGETASWARFEIPVNTLQEGENTFALRQRADAAEGQGLVVPLDTGTAAGSTVSQDGASLRGEPLWALGRSGPPPLDASIAEVGDSTTTYTDDWLLWQTTYVYSVQAVSSLGAGADKAVASATSGPYLPSQPEGVEAAPGQVLGTIQVDWQPPADDGQAPITAYKVYRGLSPDTLVQLATVDGDRTGFTDEIGLTPEPHYYAVSAVNAAGEGPRSQAVCAVASPYDSLEGTASACDL